MTEIEWAIGTDPATLAHGLHRLAGRRKLLLFAVACYRRFLAPSGAAPNDRLIEVLERYADGQVAFEDVVRLRTESDPSHPLLGEGLGSTADFWAGEFGQYHAAWQTAAAVARTAARRKSGRPSRVSASSCPVGRPPLHGRETPLRPKSVNFATAASLRLSHFQSNSRHRQTNPFASVSVDWGRT